MSYIREYAGAVSWLCFLVMTLPGTGALLAAIWRYQGNAFTVGCAGLVWIVYAFLIGIAIETALEKYNLAQKDIKVAIALREAEQHRMKRGVV